jgi:hypothetical protein
MYIAGNLCLNNNVGLSPSALIIQGNLDLSNGASVGSSSSMGSRVETSGPNGVHGHPGRDPRHIRGMSFTRTRDDSRLS